MATLCYVVTGRAPRRQQELSYSLLSALKHGLDGVEILLICDPGNRRTDLPLRHIELSPEQLDAWSEGGHTPGRIQLHALQAVLAQGDEPVCLIHTDTAFKASPRQLFDRITPQTPLLQDRAGWLAAHPEWSPLIEACRDTALSELVHPGAELYDTGLIGLHPTHATCLEHAIERANCLNFFGKASHIEQFCLGAALQAEAAEIRLSDDLVTHYSGYMRHVYHGRFDVMFPQEAPVNAAMADRLPEITEPPTPLHLRLKAKAYALRHGMGRATQFGYLAYLCAFAAPTPEGRNVWARIALDMMEQSDRPAAKLQHDLRQLTPDALPQAKLAPETEACWREFWINKRL